MRLRPFFQGALVLGTTVAVVGGSQGAEALNRGILAGLDGTIERLQILHVTGPGRAEPIR
ncbi:MAG: glycosyltransferase, partial [Planctomycetota bacterium]